MLGSLYLEENCDLTSEKKIMDAADLAAHQNSYHPVRDYLNSLTWDGTERISYCLHYFLGAEADEYTFQALRLFLLGAIHRAFRPGCKFEVMLCLVGGQGAGKSTFFRLLAGKDEWFSDDLRKLDDENVYRKLQSHWIIEMSEMIATANAKSIEEIKSFLSRQKEVYKIPYETHPAGKRAGSVKDLLVAKSVAGLRCRLTLSGYFCMEVKLPMKEIPIWEKSNLSLEEAAAYSGIGINKLREITNEDRCKFVLWVGNKRLIKRRLFDQFIEQVYSI